MALPINRAADERVLSTRLADVATATACYVVSPIKGHVRRVFSVVEGITDGAPVITVACNGANLSPTMTIASGGGAGDVDSVEFTRSAATFVDEGEVISLTSDGAGSTTVVTNFFVVVEAA